MMRRTDRHFRHLARLLTPHARLYTEMVVAAAIVHGDRTRFLARDPRESPVALQLGGSDPEVLVAAATHATRAGFDEINLNVGCPSERVSAGRFGASLMATPEVVACCVQALRSAVEIPITVKTRIGIDDLDSYETLANFIGIVAEAGCETFLVHARKAWLKRLSPRENREIPPLCYDRVHRLKRDFAHLNIIINGGIVDCETSLSQLARVDGVMIGRAVYTRPMLLAELEQCMFDTSAVIPDARDVARRYAIYIEQQYRAGVPLRILIKPFFGLFKGLPGAKDWRRFLTSLNDRAPHPTCSLRRFLDDMIADSELTPLR